MVEALQSDVYKILLNLDYSTCVHGSMSLIASGNWALVTRKLDIPEKINRRSDEATFAVGHHLREQITFFMKHPDKLVDFRIHDGLTHKAECAVLYLHAFVKLFWKDPWNAWNQRQRYM